MKRLLRWRSRPTPSPSPAMPSAHQRRDLVFVMTVAENEWLGVADLIDSLHTYLDCRWQILAVDDATADGTHEKLLDAGCWVVRNPEKLHLWGNDLSLRRGFREALRLFDCPIFVKIDPDALVIGHGFDRALDDAFKANPRSGLLGTYRIDWNGERRDLGYWRDRMTLRRRDLGRPLELALANGYALGDGVQGGCYALHRRCLERIEAAGWLQGEDGYQPSRLRGEHVAEDSLIAMLTHAAGFEVGEFGGPGQPLGLWDIGLPMSPEQLLEQRRLVAHSLKYEDDASLAARDFFRQLRLQRPKPPNSNDTP